VSRRTTRDGVVRRAPPFEARKLEFAPLPGTRDEAEAIARLFQGAGHGDVQTLSGPRATKTRLLDAMPGFKERLEWYLSQRPDLASLISRWHEPGAGDRRRNPRAAGRRGGR